MKTLFSLFILLSALGLSAQESIAGSWNTGQDNTIIEIAESGGTYHGTLASSDKKGAKIGNQMLKDLKSQGGKWKGKMYSPKKDDWFNAVLEPKGDKLMVTVKAGIMSKTLAWTKE